MLNILRMFVTTDYITKFEFIKECKDGLIPLEDTVKEKLKTIQFEPEETYHLQEVFL